MKRTTLFYAALVASGMSLAGCGQSNSTTNSSANHTSANTSQSSTSSSAGSNQASTTSSRSNVTSTGNTASTNETVSQTASGNSQGSGGQSTSGAKLSVLYAGSMTNVMEQKIKSQVDSSLGIQFQGEGKGSTALAQMMLSGLRSPDVFISASPSADKMLMGAANHNLVKWYLGLAQDQLVIAYSPQSKFAKQLGEARSGSTPWYQVLEQPGFRFGRTDPLLDPKGADTIYMFELAESYYNQPNLVKNILKSDENPQQVFPEESLLSQLTTGQVDAIVAYKHEAVEWGVPYISLPDAINLGNVNDAKDYAKATFTDKKGNVKHGAPILFTITIPTNAKDTQDAEAFVKYMVSGPGHDTLMQDGFTALPAELAGSKADVPTELQSLISGTMQG